MSYSNSEDPEQIDTTDAEDAELLLADPEDYHRAQRLKEIHDARKQVHDIIRNYGQIGDEKSYEHARMALSNAITMYIAELEPLIEDAGAEVSLPDKYPWKDVHEFANRNGKLPSDHKIDAKYIPKPNATEVFRICNRFLADVKPLLTEDETTEWEV